MKLNKLDLPFAMISIRLTFVFKQFLGFTFTEDSNKITPKELKKFAKLLIKNENVIIFLFRF